jgi:ABC-type transporter Mla subunit MlaD
MTPEEVLNTFRDLEKHLHSAKLQVFFQKQSEEIRDRFVSLRQEVTVFVGELTIEQLTNIADKLDELSDDLNAGITNLQGEIDSLNDADETLKALDVVLRLTTQITKHFA